MSTTFEPNVLTTEAKRTTTTPRHLHVAGIASLMILALFAPFYFYPFLLMKLMCMALMAASFNLLFGYGGMLSFGHAAFIGSAAYIAGYAAKEMHLSPLLAIILGMAAATAVGWLFGLVAIRRRGIQFAMITLALSQLIYFIFLQAPFTHGEDGLQDIPRGTVLGILNLGNSLTMYYFILAFTVAGLLFIYRMVNSPFGQVVIAIRDNEARATSLGYNVHGYKLAVLMIAAAIAGLGGALKALLFQIATLNDATYLASTEVVIVALVGGIGTMLGPLAGAAAIVGLDWFFAESKFPVMVINGLVFMACVLLFRQGIVGTIAAAIEKRRMQGTEESKDA
ncbi:branched-chain amino acid ABC transporter permease [Undibacter mobilis]|uniref:Branched-chain amino acid ABC transporter permease n=1 Tax=Undibacter mobilis TaxID=2292256 RepID=A0A371B357_9BRAD|nr:branched-chain amino acid ABC transporter permease [Undibacter mobilis]RDV02025.1 branched-chain amino acid ABC transporter permease [Undibacter mobilis]